MQLTLWTYEGPSHIGAMRVVAAMTGVHFVLHAPQGDSYADLLFTMIERGRKRPPVTYTSFQARDLAGNTSEMFKTAARDAIARFQPQALVVGSSCTAELLQDDTGGLSRAMGLSIPVIPVELSAFLRKENWGAGETFYQLVRGLAGPHVPAPGTVRPPGPRGGGRAATCSAPPRSASAIATTSSKSPVCSTGLASTSMSAPRSAPARPISPAWARPTSTSCSTPRWRCRRRNG